jgi:hypothetical protein
VSLSPDIIVVCSITTGGLVVVALLMMEDLSVDVKNVVGGVVEVRDVREEGSGVLTDDDRL